MTQNHHLGDARYKKLLALLTQVLGDASSAVVHWADDLATSTNLHQWVSGISGANGTGATCAQRTGLTILLDQGGTLAVPTIEVPWAVQPRDPSKAPFGFLVGGALFNGTFDTVGQLVYNPNADNPNEPTIALNFEQDFVPGAGIHTTECHLTMQQATALGGLSTRFVTFNMNRATGSCGGLLQFRFVSGADPVQGHIIIQEQGTNTEYLRVSGSTDGAQDHLSLGHNPASVGSFRASSTSIDDPQPQWTQRAALGAYDLGMMYADNIDQITFGANITAPFNPLGATNFRFAGRTQAQGGSYVVPATTDDMDLGTTAFEWRNIWGQTVNSNASLGLNAATVFSLVAPQAGGTSTIEADVIQFQDHTPTTRAFFDLLNSPGELLFYPFGANKGALGSGNNSWGSVKTNALTVAQATKTANYTIDSGGAHDCEIGLNTAAVGAFALTLPDPTVNKGRILPLTDWGNNLTVANVTLTRHGAETINGVAANLLLVTSGARYTVSCDGANWWVNKSLAGG